jgi:hypothetical protein
MHGPCQGSIVSIRSDKIIDLPLKWRSHLLRSPWAKPDGLLVRRILQQLPHIAQIPKCERAPPLAQSCELQPNFRGWYFPTKRARTEFLKPILKSRFFESERVGMSASRSKRTSTSQAFVNQHGMVWEIQKPKTGRDVSLIFQKVGAKYPQQREVIFPKGSRLALVENPRQLSIVRSGQKVEVPYLVFQEI